MIKEKSCGIIVFDDDKVLIVKHNQGHYGFPKGHVEIGETEYQTAIREVKEETNVDADIIDGFRECITYSPKENVIKDVIFFVGDAKTFNLINEESEVSDCMFVPSVDALDFITYDNEKILFKKALEFKESKYNKRNNRI